MIKKIIIICLVFCLLPIIGVLHNNLGSSAYSKQEINQAYLKSIAWLTQHKQAVYSRDNPMLWYMLKNAQEQSPNEDLKRFIDGYLTNKKYYHSSIWSGLFGKQYPYTNADQLVASGFNHYNLYLAYGLSCDKALAEKKIVQRQYDPYYCFKTRNTSTACSTHQLMGMLLIQSNQCANPEHLDKKIDSLINQIWWQSIVDFRVVDIYLQRQLMLLETAPEKINQRWIKRILDHQNDDGGWDGFQKLVPLPKKDFGFVRLIAGFDKEKSNFHATAQGVNILAILKAQQDKK